MGHPAFKISVMQKPTFQNRKKLKDTSNAKSVIVERKRPIKHFLHFTETNQ